MPRSTEMINANTSSIATATKNTSLNVRRRVATLNKRLSGHVTDPSKNFKGDGISLLASADRRGDGALPPSLLTTHLNGCRTLLPPPKKVFRARNRLTLPVLAAPKRRKDLLLWLKQQPAILSCA
mmetsp:Transcript_31191/g.101704  ORF Transcript_31191/g.101704 Transcript_31191/m.101704 type:complete len:125 (-) Transcript_31191:25-399(-)